MNHNQYLVVAPLLCVALYELPLKIDLVLVINKCPSTTLNLIEKIHFTVDRYAKKTFINQWDTYSRFPQGPKHLVKLF